MTVFVRLDRKGLNTTKIRQAQSGTVEGPDGVERVEQNGLEIIDAGARLGIAKISLEYV